MRIEQNYVIWILSVIIHIITEDFFADISDDVEKWFVTSNYDENDKRPLPISKSKKWLGCLKMD